MSDTKPNGNGKFRLTTMNLLVLTLVVGMVIWLTTALGAKANQTEVNQIKDDVITVRLGLAEINVKLDLLLDK